MPLFTFDLEAFQITDTRSAHKDTDFVAFTLKVGATAPQTMFKPMGDLNNGSFALGMVFPEVTVNLTDTVVFNYLIMNSGHSSTDQIKLALTTVGVELALGPYAEPPFASALADVTTRFAADLHTIVTPGSCDGLVAAEQNRLSCADLLSHTGWHQATSHPGTPSPHGCNSRPSAYVVTWTMAHVVQVPSVIGDSLKQAKTTLTSAALGEEPLPKNPPESYVVAKQVPGPGEWAQIGTLVTLSMVPPR